MCDLSEKVKNGIVLKYFDLILFRFLSNPDKKSKHELWLTNITSNSSITQGTHQITSPE